MVDREEYEFASDWFLINFLNKTKPLGGGLDKSLTDLDIASNRMKTNTLAGFIFSDKNYTDEKVNLAYNNFGMYPEDIFNKFNDDLHRNIAKSTKGPALSRISPYLLLNQDTINIIFEFTKNTCESDPEIYTSSTIPKGCYLVIFDYGDHRYKEIFDSFPYINKNDHFIIVNGVEFANVIGVNVEFLKQRMVYNIIPGNSYIVAKIRLNPSTFIDSDQTTKKFLYKDVNPYSYKLKRGEAFVNI